MSTIKRIIIDVIPHCNQRYNTAGDYYFDIDETTLHIKVSQMNDNRHELLVMIHEIIEVMLTEHDGVAEQDIASFDKDFESKRVEGNVDEPGDDPQSPYKKQHCIAKSVEQMMCALLGVDWKEYERDCNSL